MSKLTPESRAAKRWHREYGPRHNAIVSPPMDDLTYIRRNEAIKQLLAHPTPDLQSLTSLQPSNPSILRRVFSRLRRPFQ